jgi:hypothetical protein
MDRPLKRNMSSQVYDSNAHVRTYGLASRTQQRYSRTVKPPAKKTDFRNHRRRERSKRSSLSFVRAPTILLLAHDDAFALPGGTLHASQSDRGTMRSISLAMALPALLVASTLASPSHPVPLLAH